MSDVTVESLQLEVQSSADGAARSIDTLTSTLGKLKSATKGIGLTGVVNQIRNLDSANLSMVLPLIKLTSWPPVCRSSMDWGALSSPPLLQISSRILAVPLLL